jgi:hypothetical protein|tara:strand:+ start:2431 stop:2652 length:222 start_codon:yes stop_codon:yes gene_type:complete
MKIIQKEDGSGEIIFSWKEVWILIKKRKLVLSAEALKHLCNNLVKIAVEFNAGFHKKLQEKRSHDNSVKTKDD